MEFNCNTVELSCRTRRQLHKLFFNKLVQEIDRTGLIDLPGGSSIGKSSQRRGKLQILSLTLIIKTIFSLVHLFELRKLMFINLPSDCQSPA